MICSWDLDGNRVSLNNYEEWGNKMIKQNLNVIVIVLIIGTIFFPLSSSSYTEYAEEPLFAYKAKTIPNLDGKISPGEWDDTKIYHYLRHMHHSNYSIRCALKYDKEWLYILYTITVEKELACGRVLLIDTQPVDSENLTVYYPIAVVPSFGKAYMAEYKIAPNYDGRPIYRIKNMSKPLRNISFANYFNITEREEPPYEGIYEIVMSISYLNISYRFAPFNIEYCESHAYYPIPIGPLFTAKPGIVFIDAYYSKEKINESMDLYLYSAFFISGFIVGSICSYIYFKKYRGGKYTGTPR